jgi:hypothetical protein
MMKRFIWMITAGIFIAGFVVSPLPVVQAQDEICTIPFQSVAVPLTELGNQEYVRMDEQETGFIGGLYPNGSNEPPSAHLSAGLQQARLIQPVNVNGQPDSETGKIVMISIGMSNTNAEFGSFMDLVHNDAEINDSLLLVNGALANQTSDRWVDPNAEAWQVLANKLENLQISPLQVQVAWIKLTRTRGGDFPEKAQALQQDLEIIVQNLRSAYPNVKIAYFSSRIYSYTYWNGLSPEPNAYETGFAVRWLIEQQINGDAGLNFDPAQGDVKAPLLLWGPYLWADGENPRQDGLTWLKEDLVQDCTHPNDSGKQKVASLLMDFFKTDPTTVGWFLENTSSFEEFNLFIPFLKKDFPVPVVENKTNPVRITDIHDSIEIIHGEKIEKKENPAATFFRSIIDWIQSWFVK